MNERGPDRGSPWDRLGDFLHTDPSDAGCETTMEVLDIYAELLAAGRDPSERFPSVYAHLRACCPCREALEGLVATVSGPHH